MKNVLITLGFFALFLVSCSDNGGGVEPEPGFEPYTVGSFKFTSEKEAEYIGISEANKYKSDTDSLTVTDPIGYGFRLWPDSTMAPSDDRAIGFEFTDSTGISIENILLIQIKWEDGTIEAPVNIRQTGADYETGIIWMKGYFGTPCDFEIGEDLQFAYYDSSFTDTSALERVTTIKTEQLGAAGRDLTGCTQNN